MDPLHDKVHDADIATLAPATSLDVAVDGKVAAAYRPQGKGKLIGPEGPNFIDVTFESEGSTTVTIVSTDGRGSIWLNGLDLRRLPPG